MREESTVMTAQDRLREAGIRVTSPRVLILEYLMNNFTHPTCEQIYKGLKETDSNMSFASVYNVTDKLAQAGLIRRLVSPDGEFHYDAKTSFHGHMFCDKCNSITDLNFDFEPRVDDLNGANIHFSTYSAYGTCSKCN